METVNTLPNTRRTKNHERVGYIDALKGFLAICVVLGHIADGYLDAGIYPDAERFLYSIYNLLYSFHMPMFMMVSGYVFYTAYFDSQGQPDRTRIKRQVLNLIAIYVIFSIPLGVMKIILGGQVVNKEVSWIDLVLIPVKTIAPYWYLYVLIFLYILFTITPLLKMKWWASLTILAIVAIFSKIVSVPWLEVNRILYYMLFFYVGISACRSSKMMIGNVPLTVGLFLAAIILSILFWNNGPDKSDALNTVFFVRVVVAMGFSLILWYVFEHCSALANNRFLQMCGRYCMEIYVLHCYFTAGLRSVFLKIGVTNVYLSVAVNLVISTAIPVIFACFCKKLGIHGLLFKPVTYVLGLRKPRAAN